jgi:quinol monooxygenase YgiN
MFGVIVIVDVKESEIAQFEGVARELVRNVTANESGCVNYGLFKIRGVVGGYKFIELYHSKDAFKAHTKADHFVSVVPVLESCFATPMQIELLEGLT